MTYYYKGEALKVPFGKCMADALEEKGVTQKQQDRLISEACHFTCCDEFEKAFGENREENIDFGTGDLLGIDVLIPTGVDSDKGVIDYDWTTFHYCPYCGTPLRKCCAFCKHAKTEMFFEEPMFPYCEVYSSCYGKGYVCNKFEMKEERE